MHREDGAGGARRERGFRPARLLTPARLLRRLSADRRPLGRGWLELGVTVVANKAGRNSRHPCVRSHTDTHSHSPPGQRPSSESLLPLDSMRDWEGGAPQTWRAGLDTTIDMRAQTRGEQAKSSFRANYPVDHRPSMHNYMQVREYGMRSVPAQRRILLVELMRLPPIALLAPEDNQSRANLP